jgi:hypothetical protein
MESVDACGQCSTRELWFGSLVAVVAGEAISGRIGLRQPNKMKIWTHEMCLLMKFLKVGSLGA